MEKKDDEPIAESLKHTQVAVCDAVLQVSKLTQRSEKSDKQLALLHKRLDETLLPSLSKDGYMNSPLCMKDLHDIKGSRRASKQISSVIERLLDFESHYDVDQARHDYPCCQSAPATSLDVVFDDSGKRCIDGTEKVGRLAQVDEALQRLQSAFVKAAEDVADTVRRELLELQDKAIPKQQKVQMIISEKAEMVQDQRLDDRLRGAFEAAGLDFEDPSDLISAVTVFAANGATFSEEQFGSLYPRGAERYPDDIFPLTLVYDLNQPKAGSLAEDANRIRRHDI